MRFSVPLNTVASMAAIAGALLCLPPPASASTPPLAVSHDAHDAGSRYHAAARFANLPLHFEPNAGHVNPAFPFVARGIGYRMALAATSAEISLLRTPPSSIAASTSQTAHAAVRVHFDGAMADARIAGDTPLAGRSHYFSDGDAAQAVTDVPHFARVRVTGLYPGIDLVYYGNPRELEFDFVVAPGSDPGIIRLRFEGVDAVHLDETGDLLLQTEAGSIRQHRPRVYQEVDGTHVTVAGRYRVLSDHEVAIDIGAYDHDQPLIIDPVLSYSTFLGGRANDTGAAIAVDAAGNVYIAGSTTSGNFPLVNAYDSRLGNGDQDVYVAKLNAAGTALVYSTLVGGTRGIDAASGIAIDAQGNAYVTGSTNNNDFPTSTTAYQKAPASGGGAFALKLGPSGNTLVYSTYLLNASNTRIAVDNAGSAYVTGQAASGFATSPGAFQSTMRTTLGSAPFALKLNPAGSGIAYSTFVGGSGNDVAKAMALDSAGNVYLGGSTMSSDFPLLNPIQASLGGAKDAFVTKLNSTGSALLYSTLLGGVLDDAVNALAVDQSGYAYIGGETYSSNFPVKDAVQPIKAGHFLVNTSAGSGFIAKLAPAGDALVYSTYLGGELCLSYCQLTFFGIPVTTPQYRGDAVFGIAVDAQGHALTTGVANSYTFPLIDSRLPRKQLDDQNSIFVSKLSRNGSALLYSSLLYTGFGSSEETADGIPADIARTIATDAAGSAYVSLQQPPDFPTTPGSFQPASNGADVVIFKLGGGSAIDVALATSANPSVAGNTVTLSAVVTGATAGYVTFLDRTSVVGSASVQAGTASLAAVLPVGIRALSAIYSDGARAADSPVLHQVINPLNGCL